MSFFWVSSPHLDFHPKFQTNILSSVAKRRRRDIFVEALGTKTPEPPQGRHLCQKTMPLLTELEILFRFSSTNRSRLRRFLRRNSI
jgi:hypothetical protein